MMLGLMVGNALAATCVGAAEGALLGAELGPLLGKPVVIQLGVCDGSSEGI